MNRIAVLWLHASYTLRTRMRVQSSIAVNINEVLRRLPFRLRVVQTDNSAEFQSKFHWHLESLDIRHVYIRPRTPHLNATVETIAPSR
jgi:hypothetical protein